MAPRLVHRQRLFEQLDRGGHCRLTLVVGSPGAGKTMLIADWIASRPRQLAAWVNCDAADADPVRFFGALIEALRRASGQRALGEDAQAILAMDGAVSADVLAALADDLEHPDSPSVLVINDFHLASTAAADAVGLLLEYRPPRLQLVVATRYDPSLRLHRMRSNEELLELRDRDLALTVEETEAFFASLGIELGKEDVSRLHERTEGWVAGLQMSALSMQHSSNASSAAMRIDLQAHTVAGYFVEEVLSRQPPEVADFMLATSVLDELSVAACEALVGEPGASLLDTVYSGNLFLMLADDRDGKYRYHPMIRDVLRAELHARDRERERELLVTAAGYLADTGRIGQAARQLIAAGEPPAAFRLLSRHAGLDFSRTPAQVNALDVNDAPPELFVGSPEILIPLAAELLLRGAFDAGSRALALAERCVGVEDRQDLAVQLAFVRAQHSLFIGEFEECLAFGNAARQLAVSTDDIDQWLVGLDGGAIYSHGYLGSFEEARKAADRIATARASGAPMTAVLCPSVLSQVALGEGRLEEARGLASRALASADELGFDQHYFVFCATRTLALLALEQRDFAKAGRLTEHLLATLVAGRPLFDFLVQLDRAHVWAAAGRVQEAVDSLPAARAALKSDRSPLLARADELEARLRLALGDEIGVRTVARRLPADRHLLMSAMLALAANDWRAAANILSDAPPQGASVRSDLELRLLRATAAGMQRAPSSSRLVRDVVAIVDRQGFLQTVLETAPQFVDVVISDPVGYPHSQHIRALISAGIEVRKSGMPRHTTSDLPDPLTDAELRVLEKLAEQLSYADMAAELYLSLNTVKTHLRHTYMKLGVASRSAAVKRAASLGLL